MLKVLFGKSFEGKIKDHLILKLARGVNEQWIKSKERVVPGETPEWEFERQASLKAVAKEVFPEWDGNDIENPFNIILPGYETMWRVVLRSVLEVASTRHPAATTDAWKERLASFIQNPTRGQLQNQKNDAGLTVEHLSFEVLRLYPPTRHVARLQQDLKGDGERIQTAKIEEMHHTEPVWNPDPLTFRPERWTTLDGMDQTGYMRFGCRPFNCPAKEHRKVEIPFGVTMIAVLTACFIEAMVGEWRLGEEGIPPISKPLCNGRTSYAEVTLHPLKPKAADITSNMVDELEKTATDENGADKTEAKKTDAQMTDTQKSDSDSPVPVKLVTDNTGDNTDTDKTDSRQVRRKSLGCKRVCRWSSRRMRRARRFL